uniref:Uncharacterized protein n=1 Tax=Panagrolaimus sp. PS1159 TaxID=55785 RepID=A0AC35G420_9BILA
MDSSCRPSRKRSAPPGQELDEEQKIARLISTLQQRGRSDPVIKKKALEMYENLLGSNLNLNNTVPMENVDINAPDDIIETFPPILFAEKEKDDDFRLEDHQREAISFLYKKVIGPSENWKEAGSGSGAILAHFMGLGKTTTIVAFLYGILSHDAFKKRFKRVLIVSPDIVMPHWVNEFEKEVWKDSFGTKIDNIKATTLECGTSKTNDPEKLKRIQISAWFNNEDDNKIMIMSYEMFNKLTKKENQNKKKKVAETSNKKKETNQAPDKKIKQFLQNPGPDIVIFDEGHKVKNISLNSYKDKDEILTNRRIVLTGTPMQNNLKELYAVVNYVDKKVLGSYSEFELFYIKPIEDGKYSDAPEIVRELSEDKQEKLFNKLKTVMHRKDESCLNDILTCKKKEITITFNETAEQTPLLDELTDEYNNQLDKLFFQYFYDLNRIAAHPFIYQKKVSEASEHQKFSQNPNKSSKTKILFELLDECIQHKEKLVIFAESLETLEFIENELKRRSIKEEPKSEAKSYKEFPWQKGINYYRIDGKTDKFKREKYTEEFNESENTKARLFLLSTKTASLGISLVGATRMILFDHGFNPANNTQAVYRIYRIGQEHKEVYIYRFEIKNCDDSVLRNQITKLIQTKGCVDGDILTPEYTKLELKNRRNIYENPVINKISDARIFEISDFLLRDVIARNKKYICDFTTYSDIFFEDDDESSDDGGADDDSNEDESSIDEKSLDILQHIKIENAEQN